MNTMWKRIHVVFPWNGAVNEFNAGGGVWINA